MEQELIYTTNRHWYAKIKDGKLIIAIPKLLKYNQKFRDTLIEQWQKLIQKHKKYNHIQIQDSQNVLLFGEQVPQTELNLYKPIPKNIAKKINKALKDILLEYVTPIVQEYSQKLDYKYRDISIRKVKSKRWSCSFDQQIMFNQKLVHLSTKYVRYVVIHEVCHLKHKNHSKDFRAEVEWFLPEYKQIRKEMKKMILE
jgi:predicted metal-dependent hydrolase